MVQKKGCWKNWMIVVPCGCGAAVIVVALIIMGIGMAAMSTLKTTWAYEQGMHRASHHPEVIEALGNPVEAGWLISGNVSTNDAGGEAEFSVPLKGPNGEGKLYIKARKEAGEWSFVYAEVKVEGREDRIDLLEE